MDDVQRPGGVDIRRVQTRLDILNDTLNKCVEEINRRGQLRVTVDKAFQRPDDLVRLIGMVCLLKTYAESAAAQFGEPMTLEMWADVFRMFKSGVHILPSGKLS